MAKGNPWQCLMQFAGAHMHEDDTDDRLTQVEDEHGKAIVSWAYTDGTVHILRYPLPSL